MTNNWEFRTDSDLLKKLEGTYDTPRQVRDELQKVDARITLSAVSPHTQIGSKVGYGPDCTVTKALLDSLDGTGKGDVPGIKFKVEKLIAHDKYFPDDELVVYGECVNLSFGKS